MDAMLIAAAAGALMLLMGGKKKQVPAALPNAPVTVHVPEKEGEAEAISERATKEVEKEESDAPSAPSSPQRSAPSAQADLDVDVGPVKVLPQGGGKYTVRTEDGEPVPPNPAEAKRAAQPTADHVRNKKNAYSRPLLAAWQAIAGISSDGIYGPETVKKLRALGAKNVAGAMFKGKA